MKIDSRSDLGLSIANDIKSGALWYDDDHGCLHNPLTHQQFFLTNKDRVVCYNTASETINTYSPKLKTFLPTNALNDGEFLDRFRGVLTKDDILAKRTWGQFAGDTASIVAQGAVTGAVAGAVGGAVAATVTHIPARLHRQFNHVPNTMDIPGDTSAGSHHVGNASRRIIPMQTLSGSIGPGPLTPPNPALGAPAHTNPPSIGNAVKEGATETAFGITGGIIGGALGAAGGPPGIIVGNLLGGLAGVAIGVAWNAWF